MAAEKKLKLPISLFELIAYSLCALMAIWGIVYLVLAFAINFLPYDNELVKYNGYIISSSKMGLLAQGFLILGLAVVVAVVILLSYAKIADREFEKKQRRNQVRKSRLKEESEETVVEVESTPVANENE